MDPGSISLFTVPLPTRSRKHLGANPYSFYRVACLARRSCDAGSRWSTCFLFQAVVHPTKSKPVPTPTHRTAKYRVISFADHRAELDV